MKLKSTTLAFAAVLAGTFSASAMATTWDFYALSGGGSLGTTYNFTQGSESVFAESVYDCGLLPASVCAGSISLYGKGPGSGPGDAERGLGLATDPNGTVEIFFPNGVYLNLAGTASGYATNVKIGSVQTGESWQLLGYNGVWSVIAEGLGGGVNDIIDISSGLAGFAELALMVPCANSSACFGGTTNGDNDIVLMQVTTADVPEPATLALLGLGLAGLGFARRRKA